MLLQCFVVEINFLCDFSQIVKVLNLYTPVNEFEERVSIAFIRTIQVIYFENINATLVFILNMKELLLNPLMITFKCESSLKCFD